MKTETISDHVLHLGACAEVMATMPAESVDSIVTDPPYGLGFMGKAWDISVPEEAAWEQCLRVLKPGGHLLAFGGSRTYHRLACSIEFCGFEIRDQIMWIYGSGFPKSMDVSKAIDKAAGAEREKIAVGSPVKRMIPGADQNETGTWIKDNGREYQPGVEIPATEADRQWDGWGTALKPAHEPIVVARKPIVGTVAANVLAHGTGAINVVGCRVGTESTTRQCNAGTGNRENWRTGNEAGTHGSESGRWPANVIHDGSEEVVALFPVVKAGGNVSGKTPSRTGGEGTNCYGEYERVAWDGHGDFGSAARFFYCAKADKDDRGKGNNHPTVKPTDLMRYLIRMVTPPGGVVLDCFMGSGSTGKAAVAEGFRFIGIEREDESFDTACRRVRNAMKQYTPPLFA